MATVRKAKRASFHTRLQRLTAALGWTRSSYVLMSGFVATLFV